MNKAILLPRRAHGMVALRQLSSPLGELGSAPIDPSSYMDETIHTALASCGLESGWYKDGTENR